MGDQFSILTGLALLVCMIIGLGIWSSWRFNHNSPISIAIVISAIVSFFGLLYLGSLDQEAWKFTDRSMRTAIAGAIVIEYLALVGIVAFFTKGPEELPPISKKIITSFTAIVAVVIAFYFGSTTYIEVKESELNSGTSSSSF